MDFFNQTMTAVFDALLYPFRALVPIWGLTAISIVTGAILVWLFGRISNQEKVRTLKAMMKGHLLEVWIFREQLRNVVKAEGRVMHSTSRYLLCALPAFFVLMIPVVVVMIQLQGRYGYRPLKPGEHAMMKIRTSGMSKDSLAEPVIQLPEGLVMETPALRLPESGEIDYRIGAVAPGRYDIGVDVAGQTLTKSLAVGPTHEPLSPLRSVRPLDQLLYPVEVGLPAGHVTSVEIMYPPNDVSFLGFQIHWVWLFLIISIIAGYALKGVFRVEL